MSYHHCPIEPSDWSDGPNELPDCPECEGTGTREVTPIIAAWSEHGDREQEPCSRCNGKGYLDLDDFCDDYGI
jgi:DnaJ-class molecular chaperone